MSAALPAFRPRGPFEPQPDVPIVIDLPGERIRARVVEVLPDNSVVAEIVDVPMRPGTVFRKGDEVPCSLEPSAIGPAIWKAADERDFSEWRAKRRSAKPQRKRRA